MASSRRSASPERLTETLTAAVRDALRPLPAAAPLVLAYSGGLDSTVLLDLLARLRMPGSVLAWHVHHGLQAAADDWPEFCRAQAEARGVAFGLSRLAGAPAAGDSVEAWARQQRYRALWQAVAERGAAALLTAHHADDQVETVLMRLARGAGPEALAGMRAAQQRAGGWLLRPLLGIERELLHEWARQQRLDWIEDPMNRDPRLLRVALRDQVLPAWRAVAPGLSDGVRRSAGLLREGLAAVSALGEADLDRVIAAAAGAVAASPAAASPTAPGLVGVGAAADMDPGVARQIDLGALSALPAFRRAEAVRAWCRRLGAPPPSQAVMAEWLRQWLGGMSAQPVHVHGGWQLRRFGARLIAEPVAARDWARQPPPGLQLIWRGEPTLELAGWGGRLEILSVPAGSGIDASWLAGRPLRVAPPLGSAHLRPAWPGPSRSLKNLFQERRVPPWLRPGLPMVCDAASGEVLYVGGLGMDCTPRGPSPMAAPSAAGAAAAPLRVAFHWRPDTPGDPRGADFRPAAVV
ncbi:MAG: tRNA lysidine(34) synthetase TilS [Burkholderiaceae bacterium]